jgi:AbrB family looped-hinge helix DNA binding protein
MAAVTLSPKYQVVIPKEIRERLELEPGQKFEVLEFDGVVHLVPQRPIEYYRGRFPDLPPLEREPDRAL